MKSINSIVVPTDFSPFGEHSVDLGCQLAEIYKCTVHVHHVAEKLPADWIHWPPREKDQATKYKSIESEIQSKLKAIYDAKKAQGIDIHVSLSGGRFIKSFTQKVEELGAEMIVMGSHGASGKEEYFIGSNTQKVVRKVHLPVLVIKNAIEDIKCKTATFATSLLTDEKKCFHRFIDMMRPLGLEQIHLVAIDLDGYFSQPSIVMKESLEEFAKEAGDIPCETYFFRDYSIEAGIRHFSEEINADIIGISNHGRNPIKRILRGSNVEMLINHSDIPVLSIDY